MKISLQVALLLHFFRNFWIHLSRFLFNEIVQKIAYETHFTRNNNDSIWDHSSVGGAVILFFSKIQIGFYYMESYEILHEDDIARNFCKHILQGGAVMSFSGIFRKMQTLCSIK